jgi:hypothetical protein
MESNKINWYNDYLINETINETVSAIIGTYSRLKTKYPEHPDFPIWEKEKQKWNEYRLNLPKLFLKSEEEGNSLVKDLSEVLKEALKTEETLLNDSKKGYLE